MKLIDKDAVVAEIERLKEQDYPCDTFEESNGYYNALDEITTFLDTLEVKEVNLEKETKKWWKERLHLNPESQLWMDAHQSIVFAKHFFELGLKSKSSYVSIPNIDDTLKEMGVDPDSKDVKNFKESFYEALENLKKRKENSNG